MMKVSEIILNLEFTDPDGMAEPSSKEMVFSPNKDLTLNIKCPYVSCVNGGFDLSSEVNSAIVNKIEKLQIKSICQGWQDRRRINKNRCLCNLSCSVSIGYINT